MQTLSPRLKAIADLIPYGSIAADVGTDHAFLPIFLVQKHICSYVFASDLRKGPLQKAKENAATNGISDQIRFIQTDGLRDIPEEYSVAIISGMGGVTIQKVLSMAPQYIKTVRLLLQPQSKRAEIFVWLYANGFSCKAARLVKDGSFMYIILDVYYTGETLHIPMAEAIVPFSLLKNDSLLPQYYAHMIKRMEKIITGKKHATSVSDKEIQCLTATLSALRQAGTQYGL